VVRVIWLAPLDEPVPLLLAAVAIGAGLLAIAYGVGIVNRFREGGWRLAAYAPSGVAGAGTFLGLGLISAGVYGKLTPVTVGGICLVVVCASLVATGFFVEAGGGGVGVAQAGIELLDLVLRIGSNVVSFARLAAFGLTHAALGQVVWQATTGSARHGVIGVIAAVLIFAVGNALTFALEALIVAIQALRLEYYELFSRIFLTEGEPFHPWALPVVRADVVKSSVEA
jgi:V/A-type H+-transporting ATPase subunit I